MKNIYKSIAFVAGTFLLGNTLHCTECNAVPLTSMATSNEAKGFSIGNKTFLMDGKPFVVKAAEVHYSRIPRAYWEHRIKMCKALGMNTLCIYIFWNIHEQQEGKFDFTGNNDIAEFCRLAQKNGMYVIVRPGPYVCAEWEMGGLPWWLLKKTDIRLREQDPYFMERVAVFEQKVAEQLAPLTQSKGGPIIMVQVENEYGSYGEDKPYVSQVRDVLRKVGFDDVVLFQCDWSSNFTKNGLDDLVWTMNFGTGANIKNQFQKLQELRPTSPLMCSEFWSGWFDGWGRGHETRSAKDMVGGIKEMLDNHISFSLYMTHGGTSFGQWAGANSPGFKPDCTSYDYDAPINEQGAVTPKFFELRDLLSKYTDGQPLPDVPKAIPVMSVKKISFTHFAPLFANLPKPIKSDSIRSMEFFNQGYGSVLYTTQLPANSGQVSLKITEPHDYVQVFVDGRWVGKMDRCNGEKTVLLPSLPNGGKLELFVEAMGRINFGRAIKDYKGITEKVELIADNAGTQKVTELMDWNVRLFPVDYKFVSKMRYGKLPADSKAVASKEVYDKVGCYKATFQLNEVADTYLDMQTWGKGLVWVNGHCIGRYWKIGPQQTLFMPGCWLKKGKNEIIVMDIVGPASTEVEGLDHPIIDQLRLEVPMTHRKPGETLTLADKQPVVEGHFAKANGWQEVSFGRTVKGRYLCIEALNGFDGNEAAIAEIYALGADGKRLSREPWTVDYADSEEVNEANCAADRVFDLQESTYWKTVKGTAFPHVLVIDLGGVEEVSAVQYLPRMEAHVPGAINQYRIYVSEKPFSRVK